MSKETKENQPNELTDKELDEVAGGFVDAASPYLISKGKKIIWADKTDGDGIKKPGTKQMERVFEDDE